ncbi:lantibiotic dehydratase [Salinispora arenicola]|uniref:lantibiotic dehydratase n=1 Tax=Salinispora arenicola TaxID=168697 RepID=UPI0027DCFC1A|nr:lantibiotic dehydratase [Salinispora arenicola]
MTRPSNGLPALTGSPGLSALTSTFQQRSARSSLEALTQGRFTVALTGMGRSAMATSGRFLDGLPYADRELMCREFARLPVAVAGAMPAQLSFPPRKLRTQNVLNSRQVLPWPDQPGRARPADRVRDWPRRPWCDRRP